MLDQARAAMGEVEVLVHSALIPYAIKSFEEISADELGGKVDQEIRAALVVTKAVVPGMTTRGYGRIVYLGTMESALPLERMIALGTIAGETTRTHVKRILFKLSLRDRTQAVVIAYETGLVTPGG